MSDFYWLFAIIWLHFLGDFILQTDAMAINKSKSNKWLCYHCALYCVPLVILGWKFALVNGVLHFVVDFFTSRINSKLWAKNMRHWFFVGVGADQAIHFTILIATYQWLKV